MDISYKNFFNRISDPLFPIAYKFSHIFAKKIRKTVMRMYFYLMFCPTFGTLTIHVMGWGGLSFKPYNFHFYQFFLRRKKKCNKGYI